MTDFENMTKQQALDYCYKHEKEFKRDAEDDGAEQFSCLIEIIREGTIEPKELPDYGMHFNT